MKRNKQNEESNFNKINIEEYKERFNLIIDEILQALEIGLLNFKTN